MIYLDHAATTPMRRGVWEAMRPYAEGVFGNSSGVHHVSRQAKNALEDARERVASCLAARPGEIVLTSGGTESDNLALKGVIGARGGGLVTIVTEHEAILEPAAFLGRTGHEVHLVEVDGAGLVDPDRLAAAVGSGTTLVSVMAVNNETGVVQDIATLVSAVKSKSRDVLFHCDAVQAYAALDLDVGILGVDLLTVTGHKFGGPKGAGLLYVRDGVPLEPVLHGGGQEMGRRSGTHDVAGAVGLATAMEAAKTDRDRFHSQIGSIRDDFEKRLNAGVPGLVVNTPEGARSPHHLNVRIPGVRNEALLIRLDQAGVAASAGSACQSGAAEVSHVLGAMGLSSGEVRESLRFSFGWSSTMDEAIEAADLVSTLVGAMR